MGAKQRDRLLGLIGASPPMLVAYDRIEKAASSDVTVLLTGESGTGKELAAHAIATLSDRAAGPFITVNTGAIPRELTASELFGHEEGSFTGAIRRHVGKFEAAHRGTLFLDEIAATDPATQVSLLRALEERAVTRLGASRAIPVDVRFIAATNEDLAQAVRIGKFREDLFYRLDVFQIAMPPLRQRGEDLLLLAHHFLAECCARLHLRVRGFDHDAIECLRRHPWPGNVRELRNAVEHAAVCAEDAIVRMVDLPPRLQAVRNITREVIFKLRRNLGDVEKSYVRQTLEECGGNKKETARVLGISRKALYDKLARWRAEDGLPPEEEDAVE